MNLVMRSHRRLCLAAALPALIVGVTVQAQETRVNTPPTSAAEPASAAAQPAPNTVTNSRKIANHIRKLNP